MRKNKNILIAFILTSIVFTACDSLHHASKIATQVLLEDNNDSGDNKLDIAAGLKEALRVGTDTAVSKLNIADGYFGNKALKILLPNEIQTAMTSFRSKSFKLGFINLTGETIYISGNKTLGITSLKEKEEALILGINRAAEAAAGEAAPVFVNAITSMTITDANGILRGSDSSATTYLKQKTYSSLFNNYEPKIETSLNTIKVGNKSVVKLYEDLVTSYNKLLNTSLGIKTVGEATELDVIKTTDLSAYATEKGLNGLFIKVTEEERNIRKNPLARVTDLLSKVFGELD